ncbi:hypothetical protein [Streptomyces corynorhini]|uniref:hypothetical protein n=1 Tax=Streptomyces corynorhini TaxID=2282652 RepID=UPI001F181E56|nr:hypothetical protein [Streptomyces corynorhini]
MVWCGALALALALTLAAAGGPVLLTAAVVVAGIGEGPQLTAVFAVRHREAPERLRGRVFVTGASLKITGFALGAALAGPLAVRSLPGALLAGAAVEALAVVAFASVRVGTGRGTGSAPGFIRTGPVGSECRRPETGTRHERAEEES